MKCRILFIGLLMLLGVGLFAGEYRGDETVRVAAGDTLPEDLFAGSRSVWIDGVVQGDVYAGCQSITVNGEVSEDVLAGCQKLTIHGKVGDMVLFFGQTLTIDGEVTGDVLAFGGEVRITENAHIGGDLFVGTGELNIEGGTIEGKIGGGAGRAYLNAPVGGNVDLELKEVEFGPNYRSDTPTRLTMHHPLDREKAGNVPENLEVTLRKRKQFYERGYFYWSMAAMFIVGLLLIAFGKNFMRDYVNTARQRILPFTGVGFLSLVAWPVAAVILIILILTIPVGAILLVLYFIVLYLSHVFTAVFAGDYLMNLIQKEGRPTSLIVSLVIGVLLVAFLPELPFIGWLIELLIVCFGMGSLIGYIWQLKNGRRLATA